MNEIWYSVVIPVYNEEANILPLYNQLKPAMADLGERYEILFIDDGSLDNTFKILEDLHRKDKNVKVIKFRRKFGQTAALNAGFSNANGKIIITMDGDGQNDPKDITKLLRKIGEGYDVVSGWRYERKDKFTKKAFSKFSNWLARRLTGIDIHDSGCSLKAYKKETVEDIVLFGEMHRYVPVLIAMNGFSVGEVKVSHHPRKFGRTKYGTGRLLRGFLDLIYIQFWSKYSRRPLHFFGMIGVALFLLGCIIALYKVFIMLLLFRVPLEVGPLLLLSVLLVIMGIQFIVFGFLGEIQIRTYYGKTGEKGYIVEKVLE